MLVYLLASVFLTAARADSTLPDPSVESSRIVGGGNADIKTYPYQVSLQDGGEPQCGGSIISKDCVLTAGHCVNPYLPTSSWSIRVGSNFHGRNGSLHRIEKVRRHERYRAGYAGTPLNDLALIKVTPPFNFSDTVQPIQLFGINEKSRIGEKGVVTGWGSTGNGRAASQLQAATVPIIGKRVCSKAYRGKGGPFIGQICAGYYGVGGKDACQGDSGGPLAIGGRLAGIISWGIGCAEPNYPGVFTEVAYFRRWINRHANLH